MATKLTFIGALPTVTTGADVVNAGPQTPAVADQNLANMRAGIDARAALAGSATQDFAAKTLTATTVNANNIGEITHSQGIVTTYAASGSTGIQIANNDNLNFGAGDFTLAWKGSLPDWTPTAVHKLIYKGSFGLPRFYLATGSAGQVYMVLNATTYTSTVNMSLVDGTTHSIAAAVIRESASVAGSVLFMADGAQLGGIVTIPAGVPQTVTGTEPAYVMGDSAVRQAATTQSCYAFNRALSAAEVLSLYRYGVAESDKWGSQAELITNGSFAVDASWTKGSGWTISGGTANAAGVTGDLSQPCGIQIGQRYRVTFTISNYVSGSVGINLGGTTSVGTPRSANGMYIEDIYVVAGVSTSLYVDGLTAFTGSIDNISCVKIGATLALEPEGIQPAPGQWLDSSSNKLHALQPASGSSLARKKESFEIRWTNAWVGTSETQYLAGINQAIIPVNGYIESIVAVVTGTSVQNIIAGDGVDTDRWVTPTSGLTAGTQTLAIANRVSDGTNRKMTVTPSAVATMSISWVIRGVIL